MPIVNIRNLDICKQVAWYHDASAIDELTQILSSTEHPRYGEVSNALCDFIGSQTLVVLLTTKKIAFEILAKTCDDCSKITDPEKKDEAIGRLKAWIYFFKDSTEKQLTLLNPKKIEAEKGDKEAFEFVTSWIDAKEIPQSTSDALFCWVCSLSEDFTSPLNEQALKFLESSHSRRLSDVMTQFLKLIESENTPPELRQKLLQFFINQYGASSGTCPQTDAIFHHLFQWSDACPDPQAMMSLATDTHISNPDRARALYERAAEKEHPGAIRYLRYLKGDRADLPKEAIKECDSLDTDMKREYENRSRIRASHTKRIDEFYLQATRHESAQKESDLLCKKIEDTLDWIRSSGFANL
ncbi:MAG: hypothetical protein JSS61_00865 [Verrucomicrobia bacterium]|nr:hypothetical protein [Verrucomicrobiota bacterium]